MLAIINKQHLKGFTLVEMVTVILILGVLVLGVSGFLIYGTKIFVESTSVDRALSQSRFAIERMTRDIRNAVPNSVRIRSSSDNSWQCIELMPILSSASYIDMPIAPAPAANTGTLMQASQPLTAAQNLLIYPLTPADVYVDSGETTGKLFNIASISAGTVTFSANVQFSEASPRQRYFGVAGAVSYCFESVTAQLSLLRRYQGYSFANSIQPAPTEMGTGVLMAENIENTIASDSPLSFTPGTLQNNAIVRLEPIFTVNGQTFRYQHQVQVVNVP